KRRRRGVRAIESRRCDNNETIALTQKLGRGRVIDAASDVAENNVIVIFERLCDGGIVHGRLSVVTLPVDCMTCQLDLRMPIRCRSDNVLRCIITHVEWIHVEYCRAVFSMNRKDGAKQSRD